jgi:hypothetical protein
MGQCFVQLHFSCGAGWSDGRDGVNEGVHSEKFGESPRSTAHIRSLPVSPRASPCQSIRRLEVLPLRHRAQPLPRPAQPSRFGADPEFVGETGWRRADIVSRLLKGSNSSPFSLLPSLSPRQRRGYEPMAGCILCSPFYVKGVSLGHVGRN